MAMTKAEQKAASDRIMAKLGPLTPFEQRTYDLLTMKPEEYPVPGEKRVCGDCGAEFKPTLTAKGEVEVTALQKFSDHTASHNPSPAQWAEAYKRIQEGRESAKDRT